MRHTPKDQNAPISVAVFLASGEYDQGDTALVSYDDLYDYIRNAKRVAVETAPLRPPANIEGMSPVPWKVRKSGITFGVVSATGLGVAMEATDCGDPISMEDATAIVEAVNEKYSGTSPIPKLFLRSGNYAI
jgi:hypothetical protein